MEDLNDYEIVDGSCIDCILCDISSCNDIFHWITGDDCTSETFEGKILRKKEK